VSAAVLAADWTDVSSYGYPAVFAGVLLGSIVPIVPTGAVVGAAAALAVTGDDLDLVAVIAIATVAALIGDLITFAITRSGGPAAVRWVSRGQHPERIDEVADQFHRHGWLIIVVGRLLPAGRIPVLIAAGALRYPWRRLVPAAVLAAFLWAVAYTLIGVASGGIFDSPLLATLLATALVLVIGLALNLISSRRRHRREAAAVPEPRKPPQSDADRAADPSTRERA
jgi:membrane protein DedA with SNARE-associated domain